MNKVAAGCPPGHRGAIMSRQLADGMVSTCLCMQAERVERLIGSDDYFRHQTAGLQPAAAAVGGEGITADGLAWAGASAAPPPPVLPVSE